MLTRRKFVTSVGIGAAGAVAGSWISARGREDSVWSVIESVSAQTPDAPTIAAAQFERALSHQPGASRCQLFANRPRVGSGGGGFRRRRLLRLFR